jgi:hypothetical protein
MTSSIPADDLIARCRRVYAECETYQDDGYQSTIQRSPEDGFPFQTRGYFGTRWRRPDRLCFVFQRAPEWPSTQARMRALWTTTTGAWSWQSSEPVVKRIPSLEVAIAAAREATDDSSARIPRLLLRQPDCGTLPSQPGDGEPTDLDGVACLKYSTRLSHGEVRTVWIDLNDALIRRFDTTLVLSTEGAASLLEQQLRDLEGGSHPWMDEAARLELVELLKNQRWQTRAVRNETTIVYRPRFNIPLDDAEFEFTPPTIA